MVADDMTRLVQHAVLSTERGQVDKCDVCGEIVPIPGWPFCRSEQNPDGHERGTYRWKTKFSMKTQGWTRRLR